MDLKVRKVDGSSERYSALLSQLHDEIFGDSAPPVETDYGFWWIVFDGKKPVGFAGIVPSTLAADVGYLKRAGVLPAYRGHGLQRRLLRVREAEAKRQGWSRVITDTFYGNIHSSNNLIKSGYVMFEPPLRWGFKSGLYWTKAIA